jgi:DNA-binding NarL/FixJ family response regulator
VQIVERTSSSSQSSKIPTGPDLVDIGLPALNAIEAARLIRASSPYWKILFVTQESSAEIVQEAFRVERSGM